VVIITKPGQRWDEISVQAYGNPLHVWEIISANIDAVRAMIKTCDIITAEVELTIPELTKEQTANVDLPPWRRV
jgi:phosphoribosylaminoimidazole carboxylase (NCAIR synthetase)